MVKESEIGTKYKIQYSESGEKGSFRRDLLYREYYPKYLIVQQWCPPPYEYTGEENYCNCFIIKDVITNDQGFLKNVGSIYHTEPTESKNWKQSFCEAIEWLQNYISNEQTNKSISA